MAAEERKRVYQKSFMGPSRTNEGKGKKKPLGIVRKYQGRLTGRKATANVRRTFYFV